MRLNGRISRLEDAARQQQVSQPCRWHAAVVIFPSALPRGADGQIILPPCETPATCPGAGKVQIFLPERNPA
jgi:hypothetical protein